MQPQYDQYGRPIVPQNGGAPYGNPGQSPQGNAGQMPPQGSVPYGRPTAQQGYGQPPSYPQQSPQMQMQPTQARPQGQPQGMPIYGQPPYGMGGQMYGQPYAAPAGWNNTAFSAQNESLIPERTPPQGAEKGDGKDYSAKRLPLMERTKRDRSLMICALFFSLVLLFLSLTCLVQFPVQTADGYMYVPQNALQTVTAQLDVVLKTDTTAKVADARAAYAALQEKSGAEVYLGAMQVNFLTMWYEQHNPMSDAGSTAAFWLLLAYTVLVPLGLFFTFLRTLFALVGKRTYAAPRALCRMLMPLLFVRIYSLFVPLWGASLPTTEAEHMLFPLRMGLDRYNLVVGACALFSFVLVLLARRCEDSVPVKARGRKIVISYLMMFVMAAGALLLPFVKVTGADGTVMTFSLLDAVKASFGVALPDGANAVAERLTALGAASATNGNDFTLFLGRYLPFLGAALLAFGLVSFVSYVLDANILMEHGIADKRYAKKVCNGKTSLWVTVMLTLCVGALMYLFNTQIAANAGLACTFDLLFLAPIGGVALLTLLLFRVANTGVGKFRKDCKMRKKQFLPS